jgi:hypothetical protein
MAAWQRWNPGVRLTRSTRKCMHLRERDEQTEERNIQRERSKCACLPPPPCEKGKVDVSLQCHHVCWPPPPCVGSNHLWQPLPILYSFIR